MTLNEHIQNIINNTLLKHRLNQTHAAKELRITRATLRKYMHREYMPKNKKENNIVTSVQTKKKISYGTLV